MDPYSEHDIERLQKAVAESRRKMEPYRRARREMVQEYLGRNYYYEAKKKGTPLNFMRMAARIYQRQLVPQNPRALVSTKHAELKPTAFAMRIWMDHRIREMNLQATLRRAVLDALFSFAVVKVGLAVDEQGYENDPGQPFCEFIDLDDWVQDMSVKDRKQCAFYGHRMRMPLSSVKSNPAYENVDGLTATTRLPANEAGDDKTNVTLPAQEDEDLEDMVEIWELWLPRDNIVLTIASDEQGGLSKKVLRVQPFFGPECGPYHILGFDDAAGQLIPAGPLQDIFDLHVSINAIMRKIIRQALRMKAVGQTMSEEDAKRLQKASDGDVVHVGTPNAITEARYGGPDQSLMGLVIQLKGLIEFLAGNLGALGGLGPQAETLGQDQLTHQQSSKQIQEMSYRTVEFVQGLLQALAWYWWSDPIRTYTAERPMPGTRETFVQTVSPQDREADFLELNFKIDPYSLQPNTPSARLQTLMQVVQTILMPLQVPMDVEALLRIIGDLSNVDELEGVVLYSQPPPVGPLDEAPKKANVSSREYVRRNVGSGAGQETPDQQMYQQLMAGAGQQNGHMTNGQVA